MSERRTLQIREAISAAQRIEKSNHALRNFVSAKLPALHHLVSLPDENPESGLVDFVTRYIEHAPDFIDALHALTLSAGIDEHAKVFLNMAEDYFLKPLELTNDHSGMLQLIDEAYLAHRLIEEMNDRVAMICGLPLAPTDMTMSNIIIHEILGESFANQLDLAVHYSIESFFDADTLMKNPTFLAYVEKRKREGWKGALEKWPCLAGDFAVSITLNDTLPTDSGH